MFLERLKKNWVSLAIFLVVFLTYLLTVPHTNPNIADSDELILSAFSWGVPHPPGYPLYTFLAGIFARLPIPLLSFAAKVNVLSSLLHALTVVLFFLSSKVFLQSFFKNKQLVLYASGLTSLFLAFAFSFWFHSLIAEVFPLNSFLAALTTYFIFNWLFIQKKEKRLDKWLVYAALSFGLGLSNQQAIVLLAPAFLFLVLTSDFKLLLRWKTLLLCLGVGVLGFLMPYLYVFMASSGHPFINWEQVKDWPSFMRLITRQVYAESLNQTNAYFNFHQLQLEGWPFQFGQFLNYLKNNLGWIPFLLGLLGVIILIKQKQKKILLFISLGLIGSGLFFAIWDPINLAKVNTSDFSESVLIMRRFYTFSLFFYGLLISFGLASFLQFLEQKKKKGSLVGVGGFIVAALFILITNFLNIKQNDFSLAHGYGVSFLTALEKNAILICITPEHGCFTGLYLQQVEGVRPDVTIVPADFKLRSKEQLTSQVPDLLKTQSSDQVSLIRDVIRQQINKRPLYVMGQSTDVEWLSILTLDGNPYYLTSIGCGVSRVTKEYVLQPVPSFCDTLENQIIASSVSPTDFYQQVYSSLFASHRYYNSVLYLTHNCLEEAKGQLNKSLELSPSLSKARNQLTLLNEAKTEESTCPVNTDLVTKESVLTQAEEFEKKYEKDKKPEDLLQTIFYTYQATMIDPQDITSRMKVADLYKAGGYNKLAEQEYKDILLYDPTNEKAQSNLSTLP